MKATKKIVAAACALVAATALAAGSTFAWFATNNSIEATGLKMKVNTASSYLIIGNSTQNSMTAIKATNGGERTTTFQTASSKLSPVAHSFEGQTGSGTEGQDGYKPTIPAGTALSSTNITARSADSSPWYTRIADADSAAASTKKVTPVAYTPNTYVLADTLYVSVKTGSGNSAPLHVGSVTVAGTTALTGSQTVSPVSVIFVCGTNVVEFKNLSGTAWSAVGATESDPKTKLADVVKDSTVDTDLVRVDVYVYYDGNNSVVYTNNAVNLVGATISVTMQAIPET